MKPWTTLSALFAARVLIGTAAAQGASDDSTERAYNNLGHEHIICSAYDSIVAECLLTNPDGEESSNAYKSIAEHMFEMGYELSKRAGVSDNAVSAKFEIEIQQMMSDIGNNCRNISMLSLKYARSCKLLFENPTVRLKELLGQQ